MNAARFGFQTRGHCPGHWFLRQLYDHLPPPQESTPGPASGLVFAATEMLSYRHVQSVSGFPETSRHDRFLLCLKNDNCAAGPAVVSIVGLPCLHGDMSLSPARGQEDALQAQFIKAPENPEKASWSHNRRRLPGHEQSQVIRLEGPAPLHCAGWAPLLSPSSGGWRTVTQPCRSWPGYSAFGVQMLPVTS